MPPDPTPPPAEPQAKPPAKPPPAEPPRDLTSEQMALYRGHRAASIAGYDVGPVPAQQPSAPPADDVPGRAFVEQFARRQLEREATEASRTFNPSQWPGYMPTDATAVPLPSPEEAITPPGQPAKPAKTVEPTPYEMTAENYKAQAQATEASRSFNLETWQGWKPQ